MSQDQDGISLAVPCFRTGPSKESHAGESTSCYAEAGIPAAGSFWQDPSTNSGTISPTLRICTMDTGGGLLATGKSGKSRPVTVAYVVNSEVNQQNNNAEHLALQCLKDACDTVGSKLDTVNFGKLDFGETTVLDHFYNAAEDFLYDEPKPV